MNSGSLPDHRQIFLSGFAIKRLNYRFRRDQSLHFDGIGGAARWDWYATGYGA
jgi:hypothetical protein